MLMKVCHLMSPIPLLDFLTVFVSSETYDLFSRDLPQRNLGMIDDRANVLDIEVAGHQYEIRQSPGLLTSSNNEGTTGAALWKISPTLAEWLSNPTNVLWANRILRDDANVVELGCGITGLIGCVLARKVGKYVLTDQRSVLKLLQANVDANAPPPARSKRRVTKKSQNTPMPEHNVAVLELNWETDHAAALDQVLPMEQPLDLVIVCDCVFNDFLLKPLTDMCEEIAKRSQYSQPVFLFAQQLRSDQVFSAFLELLCSKFRVWRVLDMMLPPTLQNGSGFAVHLAILR